MRIIKFRGKRTDTGELVFGDLIHGVGSKHGRMYILPVTHIYPKGCNDLDGWEVIPETVGQFTGLLDKNGKEIYEGDIVKSNLAIGIPNTGCSHKIGDLFVIVCLPSGYTLMAMRDYMYESRRETSSLVWNLNNYFLWNYHNDFEVIDNIYDNPELLKGGKE